MSKTGPSMTVPFLPSLWKQEYCAEVRRQLEKVQSLKPHTVIDGDWYSFDEDDRNWWKN